MKFLGTLITFIFSGTALFAQVTIAPTNLFVDDDTKFGTYIVVNNSEQNQEVSVDFLFAYSKTDVNGSRKFIYDDSLTAKRYSIADQVRAFPQNFILSPGQKQIVRLRINAPLSLPDGTYWSRIKTKASAESAPIEMQTDNSVSASMGINVEQITGLFYKKGDVTTGIEIEDIITDHSADNRLIVLTDLKRTGNSPFLGSITVSLSDNKGNVVRNGLISTSIYFDGTHRQELDISDLPRGEYTVTVKFESQRSDVSSKDLIQMEPVSQSTKITIP